MGVFPNLFLKPMEPAVDRIVQRVRAASAAGPFRVRTRTRTCAPPAPSAPAAPAEIRVLTLRLRRRHPGHLRLPGRPGRDARRVVPRAGTSACRSAVSADHRPGRRRHRLASSCWDRNATSFGVVTADNFALFVNLVIVAVGLLTVFFASQTLERDSLPAGEFYALDAVLDRRHDADGAGDRSPAPVPGARDDVDCGVRADRHPPRSAGEHGGGVQVLPARRLCQLVLPLRHRVHLRRDRQHQPRSRRAR